ncbi:MAG: FecR family protein [Fibrobacter sp.]|nr:FecR family protein [Fibrobacter sp.]
MLKKSLVGLGSVALALSLTACNEEKQAETPKALGTQAAEAAPVDEVPENAVFKAKVRKIIGESDMQKSADADWKRLRQGQTVVENNRIRTAVESEATLGVNDGSILTVSENSEVTVTAEMLNSMARKISVVVKNGNVYFDIQKQERESSFEFKTGTATAAIRGTAGFVGSVGGQTVASLKEGRVEVTNEKGETTDLVQDQTVLVNKDGKAKNLKLKASGTKALAKAIDSIATAAGGAAIDVASLESSLEEFDKSYTARRDDFEKSLKFEAMPIQDTVYEPTVTLLARVTPGVVVSVLSYVDTVPATGVYQRTIDADAFGAGTYGKKRFMVSCGNGDVESLCFTWTTVYAQKGVEAAPAEEVQEQVQEEPKAEVKEEPKAAAKPAVKKEAKAEEKKAEEPKPAAKSVTVKVAVAGGRTERQHLDPPQTELKTNLKFSLSGITEDDLGEIKSIEVRQGGKTVASVNKDDLDGLNGEVPVSIQRNHSTEFEVVVTNNAGKKFRAKKTYEVFCYLPNHPGGKARNALGPKDAEYDQVVQAGQLIKD